MRKTQVRVIGHLAQTQFNAALDQSIGEKIQIDTNGYRLADQAATPIGDCDCASDWGKCHVRHTFERAYTCKFCCREAA